jgi:protein-S-isoprenylcysteine O-methyltransferase Ste14
MNPSARSYAALLALFVYVALACGARMYWHRRRTGSTGLLGLSGRPLSIAWWSGVAFVAAAALAFSGPALALAGVAPTLFDSLATFVIGCVAVAIGTCGTVFAQSDMGSSWRIGVRESERTSLVTGGLFAIVRNPIFSFMLVGMFGIALMASDPVTMFAFALFLVAVELQVRLVEEPYLRRVHGSRYLAYCRSVGRFLPAVGATAIDG